MIKQHFLLIDFFSYLQSIMNIGQGVLIILKQIIKNEEHISSRFYCIFFGKAIIGLSCLMLISCTKEDENITAPNETIKIPVIVHIIHNGEEIGEGPNITFEQVKSQIEVLNEDYRKKEYTNGFNINSVGADMEIMFFLAEYSPSGNKLAEAGIDRVNGGRQEWPKGILRNPIETTLKPATFWDPTKYLNIWTVNFGGFTGRDLLGYAQFPSNSGLAGLNSDGGLAETDGVVIGYKYFGSSQKGDFDYIFSPFNLGRTCTHEIGHWLGLRHIWGDGECDVDDYCYDTPNASEPSYGCLQNKYSCRSYDMIENYMDYSDDACMNTFTIDQKSRITTVLNNSPRRKNLYNNYKELVQ
ncbi:MAG: zinc metalloprotease [Reichenbachiella sp.]|uniref:zinc metalloprotease n=1 Tax=Reichenbachiella sp. TaxID=2184521 RepID=UPI003296F874